MLNKVLLPLAGGCDRYEVTHGNIHARVEF